MPLFSMECTCVLRHITVFAIDCGKGGIVLCIRREIWEEDNLNRDFPVA